MSKMAKHNFKIGDKVKLKDPNSWENIGDSIGEVMGLIPPYIRVGWGGSQKWMRNYPHRPGEIEYVIRKGEQLLFSFMKGG